MFKKFKGSVYWKAGMLLVICGTILIVLNNWISKSKFSIGLDAINDTLMPVYIGVIFAFLLCPIYNGIVKAMYARRLEKFPDADGNQKRRFLASSRAGATIACLVIVVGLMSLIIYTIVPQVVTSCVELFDNLPERLEILSDWLRDNFARFPMLADWVDSLANTGTEEIVDWIQKNVMSENAMTIASAISSGVVSAINFALDMIIGILIMIYLLNYKEKLFAITKKLVAACFNEQRQDSLYEFAGIVNETFIGFIVGRIIDSFIIGVLTYIVLIVCNISFAPMIGVIVGVTNVIPFFGPFIGAIPSGLILMLEDPKQALVFVIIIVIIQQLDGNVIGPNIVGNVIGIESFWVLVGVLIGGGLFGFTGMVFGVPVFAVLYRYINKLSVRRLRNGGKAAFTADYLNYDAYGVNVKEISPKTKKSESTFLTKLIRKPRRSAKTEGTGIGGSADENSEETIGENAKDKLEKFVEIVENVIDGKREE